VNIACWESPLTVLVGQVDSAVGCDISRIRSYLAFVAKIFSKFVVILTSRIVVSYIC